MKNLKFRFELSDDKAEIISCVPYKGYNETECREFLHRLIEQEILGDGVREIGKVLVVDDTINIKMKIWDDVTGNKEQWLRFENDFPIEWLLKLENRTPEQLERDACTGVLGGSVIER